MKGCIVELQFIVAAAQDRKQNREMLRDGEGGKDLKAKREYTKNSQMISDVKEGARKAIQIPDIVFLLLLIIGKNVYLVIYIFRTMRCV